MVVKHQAVLHVIRVSKGEKRKGETEQYVNKP